MIIFGKSKLEHDRNLLQFLKTTRKNGLVLNKLKLQFKKQEVYSFGHRWNSYGITPDPKKIDSILKMEFSKDKETMDSFLGLIDFFNWYIPQIAELCAPLQSLILKDAHYNITEEHRPAFAALKNEFRKTIVLPYFDKYKDTILQIDASKKVFGAVILQDNNPVYYASCTLTSAEKNYQNLE